jgi:hypothetical protein
MSFFDNPEVHETVLMTGDPKTRKVDRRKEHGEDEGNDT